jgi:glycosyltransferase involved in cell wall biosynthesis
MFCAMIVEPDRRLRVGFLHLGAPEHGVSRYGRVLAGSTARRSDCEVVESTVDSALDVGAFAEAFARLRDCDVIHTQFNRALFGDGWRQVAAADALLAGAPAPLVVNLHDVYLENPWQSWRRSTPSWRQRFERLRHELTRTWPTRRALSRIVRHAAASIVCFECERARLAGLAGSDRVRVVPHFVEARPNLPPRKDARDSLRIGERRLITVLGYIHRRKGHDLVVDSLALLPSDVMVAFVGGATADHARELDSLVRRARKLIGEERFAVTGYVDEPTLERWIAATDVALCPFRFFSASGSLATWLSAARPIVCHQLPQIAEYRRVAPDAFITFDRFEPASFAAAVEQALGRSSGEPDPGSARLRDEFSLERVTAANVAIYRDVAASRDSRRGV